MDSLSKQIKTAGYILLELAVYPLLTAIIAGVLAGLMHVLIKPGTNVGATGQDPYIWTATEFGPLLIGSVVALLLHQNIFSRSWTSTGIVKMNWLKEIGYGYLLAFVLLLAGFLILLLFGLIKIDTAIFDFRLFLGFLLLFFIQSSFEEVLCRSFMISAFSARANMWLALMLSSFIFAVMHGGNPNISFVAMINLLLAGVLMGLLFIWTERIWLPIGLHAGWNFLQGSFFGFEVSGLEVYSFLRTSEHGNDTITGGAFGYEGSILCTISLFACCYWLVYRYPEMMQKSLHHKEPSA